MAKLKAKQERFCQEYLKDPNGAQAAIRAGYATKSARQIASELLTFPHIKARIAELMAKAESKAIMSAAEVLSELSLLGRTDMAQFVTVQKNGAIQVRPFDTLPVAASRCIRKIKQKTVRKVNFEDPEGAPLEECTTEFELWDKVAALDKLGRHHDLFDGDDDPDDDGDVNISITYVEAQKPEAKP